MRIPTVIRRYLTPIERGPIGAVQEEAHVRLKASREPGKQSAAGDCSHPFSLAFKEVSDVDPASGLTIMLDFSTKD